MNNIKAWIKSWFDVTETTEQYNHSLSPFKMYYDEVRSVIGDHYATHVDNILSNVCRNIQHVEHHHFLYRTTFKSKSSSIAEANNGPMKFGTNPVESGMNLATNAHVQTLQVESKEQKTNVRLSKRLRIFSTFSHTKTKDLITDFIDLRLCDMYDNRDKVTSVYAGNGVGYCIGSKILSDFISSNTSSTPRRDGIHLLYVNVRVVKMVGKYITCTCGMVHSFQTPCIHIMSVLEKNDYVTASMIPIRWWYAFLY